jgi:hypothetical protein
VKDLAWLQHFTTSDIEKFAALDDAMLSTVSQPTTCILLFHAASMIFIQFNVSTHSESLISQPNSSASADTDTTASNQKTPGKRNASKHTQIDASNLDSQFSSTRAGKLIKKEKP